MNEDHYHYVVVLRSLGFKVQKVSTKRHDVNGVVVSSEHLKLLGLLAKDVLSRAHEARCECKVGV